METDFLDDGQHGWISFSDSTLLGTADGGQLFSVLLKGNPISLLNEAPPKLSSGEWEINSSEWTWQVGGSVRPCERVGMAE
jgi:hypothetical protein